MMARLSGRRSIVVVSLTVLAVAMTVWLSWSTWPSLAAHFPLRKVQVEGPLQHVGAATVRDVVAPLTDGGFFGADLVAIRSAVMALPWVRQVRIQRLWPDGLRLVIGEQRAVGHSRDGALVNEDGELFRPATVPDGLLARLPELDMPLQDGRLDIALLHDLERLLQDQRLRLQRVRMTQRGALRLTLTDKVELLLGREEQLSRLARFVRVYPRLTALAGSGVSTIDLRYRNGLAVRRQSSTKS